MSNGALKQADEFSPGDVCDGYRILALIAAGGMGDVYEAVHEASGNTVAFKCLKVRHRNKEDARARMKMEAVVLSELQHTNLVQVFDAGVTDSGMVWIAMERLQGQTLREVIHRAGQLPIDEALFYASEIADGVDAVHEVNVIHRDLKPENVFITSHNGVKVLDLGTGKFTGYGLNSTDKMRVIGTTAYMSPEQIKGLAVDSRADVYALGLIAYEMISGNHPLSPAGGIAALPRAVEQVALLQLQMTPPPLSAAVTACPRYISTVIERAMAKDRDARYVNMSTFARELRAGRKRFLAENRVGEGSSDGGMYDRGLREKFGAPPRQSSKPPPPPAEDRHFAEKDTVMDFAGPAASEGLRTDQQPAPHFFSDGVGGAPPSHEPTLEMSPSSAQPMPPIYGGSTSIDITYRDDPQYDVRNRTTHTNPLLIAPLELTPEPLTMPRASRSGWSSWLRHPFVRRSAATLGLGALIGVPPAVIGVMWTVHRQAQLQIHDVAPEPTLSALASDSPHAAPLGSGAAAQPGEPPEGRPEPTALGDPAAPVVAAPTESLAQHESAAAGGGTAVAVPSWSKARLGVGEVKPLRATPRPRPKVHEVTASPPPRASSVAPPTVSASAVSVAPAAPSPAAPASAPTFILPPSGL